MSRQIDLTKPLSDEDRQYLVDRARTEDIRRADTYAEDKAYEGPGAASEVGADRPVIDDGNTGDVDHFKADDGSDQISGNHPDERAATLTQAIDTGAQHPLLEASNGPTVQAGDGNVSSADSRDYDKDYEEWSKKDLEKEIEERNEGRDDSRRIAKSGTIPELAARLDEDDDNEDDEDDSGSASDSGSTDQGQSQP